VVSPEILTKFDGSFEFGLEGPVQVVFGDVIKQAARFVELLQRG
jgi:hypothetical protein